MTQPHDADNDAFGRFMRRIWREDVAPLLRDQRRDQRAKSARAGGKVAAAAGLFVDTLLRLRGKPFTRAMTVMGSSLGAMLPDVWDWKWLRETADARQRAVIAEKVKRRADELPEADALAVFNLKPTATQEQLREAWRGVLQRWHPDKAPDDAARAEYHVRFLAYKSAHERLLRAFESGRLPMRIGDGA